MKRFSFLLSLTILASSLAISQESETKPSEAGFLQFVNLISLSQPTYIELGSFKLNGGEPVAPGDTSGILAIKPNEYNFVITNSEADPDSVSGPLSIVNGRNVVVICYDETEELEDGTTKSEIKFNLLTESLESDLPRLSLVSLLQEPAQVSVAGKPVMLHERRAFRSEVKMDEVVPITMNAKSLGEIEISNRSHYIGFVYRDPETGEEGLSIIQNEKLEYHPPLEEEENEDSPADETPSSDSTTEPAAGQD